MAAYTLVGTALLTTEEVRNRVCRLGRAEIGNSLQMEVTAFKKL